MATLDEEPLEFATPLWRRVLWWIVVLGVFAPVVGWVVALVTILLTSSLSDGARNAFALATSLPVALAAAVWFGRRGVARGWPERNFFLFGPLVLTALGVWLIYPEHQKIQLHRQHRLIAANLDQLAQAERALFAKNPEHFVFTYDELVGEGRPIAALTSVRGEDYRTLYPRHFGQIFFYAEPPKISVAWEPLEESDRLNRENPHRYDLPGGGRLEVELTRGTLPDGAVRAYRANGQLWFEGTCKEGRLVGEAWIHPPAGPRYNALAPRR